MPTPSTKKKTKKIAEDPLSSSGVSSLSGISSYNIRKISIYKNGDRFHRGVKFVINPRVVKDMEPLLNQINDRIELSHGAKKLYTTDGKVVGSIKELEDGKIYVAASAQFIPMRYGEFTEKVWKPPSRKHSPIMSSDRIKTARTRSQDPSKRRQPQNSGNAGSTTGSGVQRSRSVRTLAEDRKSRRDISHPKANGSNAPIPKKFDQPRPKAPAPKQFIPKPRKTLPPSTTTTKKPPTPKRKISKKVLGAAAGVGVTVVGAAALGAVAAASKKAKPATPKPKPIPTAVSDISTASSVMPVPNVESSGAAEILEFPEEEKKIDMAMIHRTPTPPQIPSRAASAKSIKKPETPAEDRSAKILEAKSVSQQPTPEESSEEDDEGNEDDEDDDVEDDEEEAGSEEVEEPSDEEEEEDDEEEDEEDEEEEEESRLGTPASRPSSSALSSAGSQADDKDKHDKDEDAKK
ncbi:hypothetical protein L5515_014965 [Caenorhabditis briggsae]|uniref:Doublecortin domain-containing protein n=1 Tax=Caenorhabditis briggsae TaxID=6238 RepID=A0AAE9EDD9_CAEBR|nr:hypothetical protein L5515_014965 [Caenorhabditis briggsae]